MEKSIWLSYDLGISGDYEGLYAWLDDRAARECGDNVAFFRFAYERVLVEELKEALSAAVTLNNRSRIYAVYRDDEKTRGKFLFGGRRRPPWEGCGAARDQEDDED